MPRLTVRPFVVTGCARSGTTYTSLVLPRLGLRVGHEAVFTPRTRAFVGMGDLDGDCSWLAVPFLNQLGPDSLVIHQVRHPLLVVRSLLGVGFFEQRSPALLRADASYHRLKWQVRDLLEKRGQLERTGRGARPELDFRNFLRAHAPEVWAEPTPAERAMRYWAMWNQEVEHRCATGGLRRRFNPVERLDAEVMTHHLRAIGLPVAVEHVQLVMDHVPTDANTRARMDVTWEELPLGPAREAAELQAARYGYDVHDPDRLPLAPEETA